MSALKITLASSPDTWMHPWLERLEATWAGQGHLIRRAWSAAEIEKGDLCFLLSCGFLVSSEILALHSHNLVVHASALPEGRGWSPVTWQILEGCDEIPITLFEAVDAVDAGPIYLQETMRFSGRELVDEIRVAQGAATLALCETFLSRYPAIVQEARPQEGVGSVYPRRLPEDSRLDLHKSLAEQFNLLRVVDSERYPAFFEIEGRRYLIPIELAEEPETP